jgi:hypothetical protein
VRVDVTATVLNQSTLAIDGDQLAQVGQYMDRQNFAHLVERLFAMPIEEVKIEGHRALRCNKLLMPVDTAIDLMQALVGPAKIARPIRCWVCRPGSSRWESVKVRYRCAKPVREVSLSEVK